MNHRISRKIAYAVLFACHIAGAQTDAALWRYVHPAAKAVIGIDWRKIQQSSAGLMLQEHIAGAPLPIPGIDFLKDIDPVLISSPGNAGDEQSELRVSRPYAEVAGAVDDHAWSGLHLRVGIRRTRGRSL